LIFLIISTQALKAAATPLRGRLFGCLLTHSPPSTRHSASLNDSNWHVKGGSTKKNATINHVIAPECSAYKKNNKTATISARTIK
jgi:hypothetical protein